MKGPEKNRVKVYGGDASNGVFEIPVSGRTMLRVISSDGAGWEHVSVVAHIQEGRKGAVKTRTPTWAEMSKVKDLFWEPEETVIQFHPPHSEYVNNHPHCLHLWRQIGQDVPRPPKELVGFTNI